MIHFTSAVFVALLCVSAILPPGDGSSDKTTIIIEGEVPKNATIGPKPVTIKLRPNDVEWQRIIEVASSDEKRPSVILTVAGVKPPTNPDVEVLVFLNEPKAHDKSAVDDPHYVGSISFFPVSDRTNQKTQSFRLNAATAIRRLHKEKKLSQQEPITVTLVPAITGEGSQAESVSLTFRRVSITIED